MAKTCLNHRDVPAITMCTQCHKPICQSCTMVTPTGKFCSSECSILYKEMTTRLGGVTTRKGGGAGMKFLFFILLLVAAAFMLHFAVKDKGEDHFLKKFDVIGKFLDQRK